MRKKHVFALAILLCLGACAKPKVSDSQSTCSSSLIYSYAAGSEVERNVLAGGSVVLTFSFTDPVIIEGLVIKLRVESPQTSVRVMVFKQRINDGLIVSPSPDVSFTTTLEGMGLGNRTIDFPLPFQTEAVSDDPLSGTQYAVALKVESGSMQIFQGFVMRSQSIQRRYAYSIDGSAPSESNDTGLTMGLRLKSPCLGAQD